VVVIQARDSDCQDDEQEGQPGLGDSVGIVAELPIFILKGGIVQDVKELATN
jgi:hypothetical protein